MGIVHWLTFVDALFLVLVPLEVVVAEGVFQLVARLVLPVEL